MEKLASISGAALTIAASTDEDYSQTEFLNLYKKMNQLVENMKCVLNTTNGSAGSVEIFNEVENGNCD